MIGRLVSGASALLLVGAVVVAEQLPHAEPPAVEALHVSVEPEAQPLACPGRVEVPVGDIDAGGEDVDPGSDDVTYIVFADDIDGAGAGFTTPGLAGATIERVGSGDVEGLSTASCGDALADQWLVGGTTRLGSSARLVLTNPTAASTEVTVEVYGALGAIEERTVVSVGPGGQADLLLEAIAPELPALVVHVAATGAGVAAALQDSRLDGFQPLGTDWVVPGAGPSTSLLVPVVGASGAAATTLRLLAPEGASVDLALDSPDGAVAWGGVSPLALEPGVVTEVAVPAVAAGAITIEADAPVVAGAMTRVEREVEDGPRDAVAADLAWSAAVAADDVGERAAVVPDPGAQLVVHAVEAGDFVLVDEDGEELRVIALAAGQTVVEPLDLDRGTVVAAEGPFVWGLRVQTSPGYLTILAPRVTVVEPRDVTALEGPYVP
ncbi:DUF5719 family protein [Demequina pelophila]|uniref:DUF5719 family protein n=1 Tax=Demequina pelophila TaxID=1638984 RepID=UPI0007825EDA|nr:DUF5719 family protein [Demequina pelophila]